MDKWIAFETAIIFESSKACSFSLFTFLAAFFFEKNVCVYTKVWVFILGLKAVNCVYQ